MEHKKPSFNEVVFGDSCPPISQDDDDAQFLDESQRYAVETYKKDDFDDESEANMHGSHNLYNAVVPNTEDEEDPVEKKGRNQNFCLFPRESEEQYGACSKVKDDSGKVQDPDQKSGGESPKYTFKKLLGAFFPAFRNLSPKSHKKIFRK